MRLNVILRQTNKKGNVSFKAERLLNIGDSDLSSVSIEIASFCKDIQVLCDKNAKLGFANAVNGIKKSLPMCIELQGIGDDDDVSISLQYRNFGRFVKESTKNNLRKFLAQNIEFAEKYSV